MVYSFRTIIEPDENGTYHGYVPALSGCHTWGNTLEETREHLREAITLYVASLREDNEEIPVETGFEAIETFTDVELALA